MKARINHITIVSEDNYALGRFYEGFFHMRPAGAKGALDDVSIGDGHVGLNIKPRLSGQPAQLDHFGIEVDDMTAALARLKQHYPTLEWLERPGTGALSAHDPDGNVFGLSQAGAAPQDGLGTDEIYRADGRASVRAVDHIALRVLHPQKVAEFYATVFEFARIDGPSPGKNVYLSDGHVTLVIIPWRLEDFEGTGISARGMDHIGFKVESVAAFKDDLARASARNYRLQPSASIVGRGKEGAGRLAMFRKTCPLGCHQLADPDGLLLDLVE